MRTSHEEIWVCSSADVVDNDLVHDALMLSSQGDELNKLMSDGQMKPCQATVVPQIQSSTAKNRADFEGEV